MSDDAVSVSRLTRLLPLAVLISAVCLFASELMTTFEFTPPGAEPLQEQGGADRHGNAQMVFAVFAVGALALAVFTASKPAAVAVAVAGVAATLLFLLVDLRVANQVGTLESFLTAETVPAGGFYLQLLGALSLLVSGAALATLSPEQISALRPARRQRPTEPRVKATPKAQRSETGTPSAKETRSKAG